MKLNQVLLSLALAGILANSGVSAQSRYTFSADGTEVTDNTTGLLWQRCNAGQIWDAASSNCAGTPGTYSHEAALALAQAGWRLPNIKELASIVDLGKNYPSYDVAVFPATVQTTNWSATPLVGHINNVAYAWAINGNWGSVYYYDRSTRFNVRLVR